MDMQKEYLQKAGIDMLFFWIVLILTMIYLFLVFPRFLGKPDYSVLKGVHYAHRGLHDNKTDAPENSLRAFEKAAKAGYGIEFDVQLSKDRIPVVFHDASLKRMCGVEGNVWDYTLKELKSLKLADSQETIPTFQEALDTVSGKVPLIIEYKLDVPSTQVCEISNKILLNYSGIYCIESFHPYAVAWYRQHRPEIIRGQLSRNFRKDKKNREHHLLWFLSNLLTNVYTRPDFIAYYYKDASMFSLRVCHFLGALTAAYTIKNRADYEKAKRAFDLFIFDSCRL